MMCNCKNVGMVDRIVRLVLGGAALGAAFLALDVQTGATAGVIAAAAGVILLGTAAIGICPLYMPLRVSTCKVSKAH